MYDSNPLAARNGAATIDDFIYILVTKQTLLSKATQIEQSKVGLEQNINDWKYLVFVVRVKNDC